jgi:hypothetical protein
MTPLDQASDAPRRAPRCPTPDTIERRYMTWEVVGAVMAPPVRDRRFIAHLLPFKEIALR